jgi:hypothetical protein
MRYRIAKPSDLKQIVNIHYAIRETYSVGIFSQLGKQFLRQYYKIILNDKNEVVVCAEDENGNIVGFCSATLDVEAQMANIRRHKLSLGLAAISSIIRRPMLIKSLIERYKSTQISAAVKFVAAKGARGEYWAWNSADKDSISSIEMHEVSLKLLKALGVEELTFEVDKVNKNVFLFHKVNGAKIVDKFILPDGRERVKMKYDLINRESKL